MANGINALIARGFGPFPSYSQDWERQRMNALQMKAAEQRLSDYPEERNWLREKRGMEREEFGMKKEEIGKARKKSEFKYPFEILESIIEYAPLLTPQNYPQLREKAIREVPEIGDYLPDISTFKSEEEFNNWRDSGLTTAKRLLEKQKAVKTEKAPTNIEEVSYELKGRSFVSLNPEEKKEVQAEAKKRKEVQKVPSLGNIAEIAISKKFNDPAYLTDPEKNKEALKWLATEEGSKELKKARDELTTPSITYLQTAEGFVPATTKGEGIGTIGKPTGLGKPIPAEETSRMAGIEALLNDISTVKNLYKPGWVGPISGRVGAIEEKYTGTAKTDQVKFYAYVRDMKDALLRARSGAQINEQEYKRLVNFLPDENLPAKSFEARLSRFEAELNNVLSSKKKALGEAGYGKKITKPGGARPPLSAFEGK